MHLERTISETLSAWYRKEGRKPLTLFGARQTGKTTSVLRFGRECFDNVAHVDFIRRRSLSRAFEGDLEPRRIIYNLEAMLDQDIVAGRTLLFLDEVQECDAAITALKYLCSELPDLHVVAAGSLLGVRVARDRASFPVGYVDMATMHPLDFGEFCDAMGKSRAQRMVQECMREHLPCPLHDEMIDLYKQYLLVGGMPEVVSIFASGGSLEQVRDKQREIGTAYVADMTKYASSADSARILASWESVPAQLAKDSGSTKFVWREISSGARSDRYSTALDWLVASGLVSKCTRVTDGVAPLKSFEDRASFKAYMFDTGMLACTYDARQEDFQDTGHRSARFRGGISENYVMQQFRATGVSPYYWGVQSKQEVDFVVRLEEGIVPIEVKSGRSTRANSLRSFMGRYDCADAIVLSTNDFGRAHGISYVPLYAAHLIGRVSRVPDREGRYQS